MSHLDCEVIPYTVGNDFSSPLDISLEAAERLSKIQAWNDVRSAFPLVFLDALGVVIAAIFANVVANLYSDGSTVFPLSSQVVLVCWVLIVQHIHGLYPACGLTQTIEFRRVLRTCLFIVTGLLVTATIAPLSSNSYYVGYSAFAFLLIVLLPTLRSFARRLLCKFDWWTQSIIIVGDGVRAEDIFRHYEANRSEGLRPIGIAFNAEAKSSVEYAESDVSSAPYYVAPMNQLQETLLATGTCRVAVVDEAITRQIDFNAYSKIPHVVFATELRSHPTEKSQLRQRGSKIDLHCVNTLANSGAMKVKRLLDIGLIILSSPLVLPVFALIALLVKLGGPGPVFYSQKRLARNGRAFHAWKFRSMVNNADEVLSAYLQNHPELQEEWERDHKLKNDPRITTIGKFLRKTSVDELPQLWNVLVGEMSLVGPRPIVAAEVCKYGDVYPMYVLVRPGITGLWQISGRNNTTYEERLAFDRYYIQNWSCMLDIYILYRTIKTALLQEGAY